MQSYYLIFRNETSCVSSSFPGPSGAFAPDGAGSNAVTLAGFQAAGEPGFQNDVFQIGVPAALAAAFALTRRRKQPLTPGP